MSRLLALDWAYIRRALSTWGLLAWFLVLDISHLLVELPVAQPLGHDAIIYARGASAFLTGGSPWDAYLQGGTNVAHFAGLPPTVIAFLPPAAVRLFPVLLQPLLGNGFVVGITGALVLEHLVFRPLKQAGT